jgi:hypothetical protein
MLTPYEGVVREEDFPTRDLNVLPEARPHGKRQRAHLDRDVLGLSDNSPLAVKQGA